MKKSFKLQQNTSIISNKNSKTKLNEILDHPKYKEIEDKFIKLFKIHGYSLSDSFDKTVWFLIDDIVFHQKINKTHKSNKSKTNMSNITYNEQQESNKIHEILNELNENFELSNLLVSVDLFIYKVIEELILSFNIVQRSNQTIQSFQANKRNQIIKESIKILESKLEKLPNKNNFESRLTIKIIKAFNFYPGEYNFELRCFVINNKNNMTQINYSLRNDESKVVVIDDSILVDNRFNDNTFDDIILIKTNLESDDKKKSSIYSGTSLCNFYLTCEDFESKKAYLLDVMLNAIDNIQDISKSSFRENLEMIMATPILKKSIDNDKTQRKGVLIECLFEFDIITRISILRRIASVFSEVIETKRLSENTIDIILDSYFEQISETIKFILHSYSEPIKSSCCDCNIV